MKMIRGITLLLILLASAIQLSAAAKTMGSSMQLDAVARKHYSRVISGRNKTRQINRIATSRSRLGDPDADRDSTDFESDRKLHVLKQESAEAKHAEARRASISIENERRGAGHSLRSFPNKNTEANPESTAARPKRHKKTQAKDEEPIVEDLEVAIATRKKKIVEGDDEEDGDATTDDASKAAQVLAARKGKVEEGGKDEDIDPAANDPLRAISPTHKDKIGGGEIEEDADHYPSKAQIRNGNEDQDGDEEDDDDTTTGAHQKAKAEEEAPSRKEKKQRNKAQKVDEAALQPDTGDNVAEEPTWEGGAEVDDLVAEHNMLEKPIHDWDEQRERWLEDHPTMARAGGRESLFMLTGTQPWPCKNPDGDHLLLRCFKNKVDYCRRHGVDIFYNMALLDPDMPTFWAKLPVVRATMLAHPEADWIWWLDADAIITDMEFEIPLQRYKEYNMVVHGWESVIFEKRSWLGFNAGSFLIRNCQWSMDLMERWASMGPQGPMGSAYYNILSDFLPDRPRSVTDDQSALVFLMVRERKRWARKLRLELDFYLSGYWVEFTNGYEATEEEYRRMEKEHDDLAAMLKEGILGKERLARRLGAAREKHLRGAGAPERRPFITHFTGCQPCSGHHNPMYTAEECSGGLVRALNYADDQILRVLGFKHRSLEVGDVERALQYGEKVRSFNTTT